MMNTLEVAEHILLNGDADFKVREWALDAIKNTVAPTHRSGLTFHQIGLLSQESSGLLRIKMIRNWRGISLKDAKDLRDELFPYVPRAEFSLLNAPDPSSDHDPSWSSDGDHDAAWIMTDQQRAWIDSASYEQLLSKWRNASIGDPMFQGGTGDYFSSAMAKRRDAGADTVAASKLVGWDAK